MKSLRKCMVCGKEYEFCSGCRKKNQPSWLTIYHDENCRNIWNAITAVYDNAGAIGAAEALSDLNLSDIDNFRDDVREKIDMIFNEVFGEDTQPVVVENDEAENDDEVTFEEEFASDEDNESV